MHFKLDKTAPKFACTYAEIFERKTYSGCSDIGIAVAPILRLKGILTIYIESAHIDWMKEVQKGKIEQQPMQGHIFLEIYLNKTWYLYDPTFHLIYCNYDYDNSFLPRGYVVFAKGMNCHELGIHSVQDSMLIEYVDPTQYKEPAYRTIDLKKADS